MTALCPWDYQVYTNLIQNVLGFKGVYDVEILKPSGTCLWLWTIKIKSIWSDLVFCHRTATAIIQNVEASEDDQQLFTKCGTFIPTHSQWMNKTGPMMLLQQLPAHVNASVKSDSGHCIPCQKGCEDARRIPTVSSSPWPRLPHCRSKTPNYVALTSCHVTFPIH